MGAEAAADDDVGSGLTAGAMVVGFGGVGFGGVGGKVDGEGRRGVVDPRARCQAPTEILWSWRSTRTRAPQHISARLSKSQKETFKGSMDSRKCSSKIELSRVSFQISIE